MTDDKLFAPEFVYEICVGLAIHDFLHKDLPLQIVSDLYSKGLTEHYRQVSEVEISQPAEEILRFLSEQHSLSNSLEDNGPCLSPSISICLFKYVVNLLVALVSATLWTICSNIFGITFSLPRVKLPIIFGRSPESAVSKSNFIKSFTSSKISKLFIPSYALSSLLTQSISSNIFELSSLQLGSVTPANVTMIFGAFKNKVQHSKFVKLAKASLGEEFVVLTVNGDETSNRKAEEDVAIAVAKARRAGKRVVIVSKDMASRSFSIPEIDTVFLMYDQGLLSQTVQKSSRAFTPGKTYNGDKKTEGVIVSLSLDANRLEVDPIDLYVMAEANRINDEEESLQISIRRICNSVNIFQNDLALGAIELDADEYAENMLQQSSVLKDIIATMSLEQIDAGAYVDAILANRSSNPNKGEEDNTSVNISNVRTAVQEREEKDREPVTPDEEKQFIKNVIFFTSNITALREIDGYTASKLDQLLSNISNKGLENEVEDFYGLKFEAIERLIDTKALPVRLLNTLLENHSVEQLVF